MIASVLVATCGRKTKLDRLLASLLKSEGDVNFDIWVLVQGGLTTDQKSIESIKSPRVRYKFFDFKNKSKALNWALNHCESKYILFTDDDCVVSKHWVKKMVGFVEKTEFDGAFGKVKSYRPELNTGKYCPSTFDGVELSWGVGSENNMIFLKKSLMAVGGFSEWLGPGTWVGTGEDRDVWQKIINRGWVVGVCKEAVVWHDRWLTGKEREFNLSRYTRGVAAIAGYGMVSSNMWKFGKILIARWKERVGVKFGEILRKIREVFKEMVFLMVELAQICIGFGWGIFLGIKDILIKNR